MGNASTLWKWRSYVTLFFGSFLSFYLFYPPKLHQTVPEKLISPIWDDYNATLKHDFIKNQYYGWGEYKISLTSGEFDPVSCRSPLWMPGVQKIESISKTFVLGITQLQRPYIKNIIQSVAMLRRVSDVDISILVLKSAGGSAAMLDLDQKISVFRKIKIYKIENPVDALQLSPQLLKALRYNPNCCGVDEFLRLHVFALPYDKAIFLDLDVFVLKPIDHLFYCDKDFMYAGGIGSPLNAGMFVARANRPQLLDHMVRTLYTVSMTYTQERCFDSLGCGPCKCGACNARDRHGPRCHGQEGPQGFLHYYFVKRIQHAVHFPVNNAHMHSRYPQSALKWSNRSLSLNVSRISSCVYDYQNFPKSACMGEWAHNGAIGSAVSPYIVHKGGEWAKKIPPDAIDVTRLHSPHSSTFSGIKPCAPEFWIIGTRKGGTTALYTWMTEHPQVARLHIENKPTDGEVAESISLQNLGRYNSHFRNVATGKLKGDSKVSRLMNDAKAIVESCGLVNIKLLVLLRDPIERAMSNMLMRARLGTAGMNMQSNISWYIEQDVDKFEEACRRDPQWAAGIHPTHLSGWQSAKNTIYEGLYAVHLRRWFLFAGVDRMRIYFTEHFEQHTAEIVSDALRFVGADMSLWNESNQRFDRNKAPNSRPDRSRSKIVDHEGGNMAISSLLRERLKGVFGPYNRMLERLLNTTTPWGY